MASEEFFSCDELGVQRLRFAVPGSIEELGGRDKENLSSDIRFVEHEIGQQED